jgi:hypothetical protein
MRTPYNQTLQTAKNWTSLDRDSAAHVLSVLRTKAVDGSCRLATISGILIETL